MLLIWKSQTENWVSVCLKPDLHNSVSLTADPRANAPLFQCTRATADKIQAEVCVCEQSCVRGGGRVGGWYFLSKSHICVHFMSFDMVLLKTE